MLPRINRVAQIWEVIGVVRVRGVVRRKDGHKSRNIRNTVVSNSQHSQLMITEVEYSFAVELVLLAVFQPVKKTVPVSGAQSHK